MEGAAPGEAHSSESTLGEDAERGATGSADQTAPTSAEAFHCMGASSVSQASCNRASGGSPIAELVIWYVR